MRIDRLEIENFKKFTQQTVELHPQFTLFVGENGSGKTTMLDALAVAAAVWLVDAPDSALYNSGRNILSSEIRLEPEKRGDRVQFLEKRPVKIKATGRIGETENVSWTRQIRADGRRTSNADAKQALGQIKNIYARANAGEGPPYPGPRLLRCRPSVASFKRASPQSKGKWPCPALVGFLRLLQ